VFSGQVQDNCSCGPYEMRDFQLDGPVTSISLFPTSATSTESAYVCNGVHYHAF
jgi:hypothetical protein